MMGRSIHIPSSLEPAGTSGGQKAQTNSSSNPRDAAMELLRRKEEVESELDSYFEMLSSHNADMLTQLVDDEGFPRADLDVAAVRTARAAIVRLRNDLSSLYHEIDQALQVVYAKPPDSIENSGVEQALPSSDSLNSLIPFAIVTGVAPESPAANAGLQRNDRILAFGSLHHLNHENLTALPGYLSENENVPIPIRLLRSSNGGDITEETVLDSLTLTPRRNWGGHGLLGCHITPL